MGDDATQLNNRAEKLMQKEQWAEVVRLIESQPQMLERDDVLSWNLGWAYFKLGDFKSSQLHLSRAVKLNPKRGASWWALGAVQREDGLLVKAERNVKRALRLRDVGHWRATLALILMQRGKLTEAEQVHLKGLELKPEVSDRWQAYGCFLEDVGRLSDAEAAYKKARWYRGN